MFNIIILGITSFLTDISNEMIYPILPVFLISTLGASPAILGLIEGIAESVASILKVFSGYWSDKLKKRKPFTIFGYVNSASGKLFLYFSSSWIFVLFGRIIERFGKGVRTAPRDALIAEGAGSGKRGAAFGLHRILDAVGAVGGVILAYIFVVYYSCSVYSLLYLPWVILLTSSFYLKPRMPVILCLRQRSISAGSWEQLPA